MTTVLDLAPVVERPSPTTAARACPVCAQRAVTVIHEQDYALFDDSDLPSRTLVVACDACGTAYASSDAPAAAYRRHYARHSKYETATAVTGSGETAADIARLDQVVACVAPALTPASRILDMGAGRGGLLRSFRRQGWPHVAGIDPSAGCVAAMRADGTVAHVGELEDARWPTDPERFDLIVLSHVLEHVHDATDAFRRIAERTTPEGRIYLEVPDAARYTATGYPPFYFFDPEHINHFDADALRALATRAGWHVEATWSRDVDLGGGQDYPVVGVLLGRGGDGEVARATTATSLARYVASCRTALDQATDRAWLESRAASRRPVVLWGAGSHAQRLLAQTALGRCAIDCIIDGDVGKQGRLLAGRRVVSPDEGLRRAQAIDADVAIAIAVADAAAAVRARVSHALPSTNLQLL